MGSRDTADRRTALRLIVGLAAAAVLILIGTVLWTRVFPSDVITLPPSASPEAKCPTGSTVEVQDLAQHRWQNCDLVDGQVKFPDGSIVTVAEFGGSSGLDLGQNAPRYFVENLGNYGVIAVRRYEGELTYWGPSKGQALVKGRASKV